MRSSQFSVEDFWAMLRRRKAAFLLPFVIISGAAAIGAFVLPKRYESSTTILVQSEGVLNPLVNYSMAVALQSDDRLRDFNQIVYSTPIIEALMDSLGMARSATSRVEKERLIKAISTSIRTDRNGSESFTITYYASTPEAAQKAVAVLAELFIRTRLRIENGKNEFAVKFFTQRLDSLRDKFEQSQSTLVSSMMRQKGDVPEGDRGQYTRIDDDENRLKSLQRTVGDYQHALEILNRVRSGGSGELDPAQLYELPMLGVPYADQLQAALSKYDSLQHLYTAEYPPLQEQGETVRRMLQRTGSLIASDLKVKQAQIQTLAAERNQAVESLRQADVAQNKNVDVHSNFDIYKEMYNEMKIKLEQAHTNRDLGENGGREFVVIDPPRLPTSPSKPNVPLMLGGGFSLGLFLGLFSAGLAEMLDSRIRTPIDIEVYGKPVLAYLPVVNESRRSARKSRQAV